METYLELMLAGLGRRGRVEKVDCQNLYPRQLSLDAYKPPKCFATHHCRGLAFSRLLLREVSLDVQWAELY